MKKIISAIILIFSLMVSNFAFAIDDTLHIPFDENKIMRAYVRGDGPQTVVILSGWGTTNPVEDFQPLVDKLCDEYQVVVLEYFGYGLSSQTASDRTNENIVSEIHSALSKMDIKPPYVLMPHSMSGIYSLYYAHHYPDEVAGIIGIDMSLPQKQLERWTSDSFPKSSDKNPTFRAQWDKFYENSEELKDVKYPDDLPVLALLSSEQIDCVNDMIATGEMKTSWEKINEDMITNPNIQKTLILTGEHYLHHDQADQIAKLSKEFIQHIH